jgi:hypothetical protein
MNRQQKGEEEEETERKAESEKQEWLRKRAGRALVLLSQAVRNANDL